MTDVHFPGLAGWLPLDLDAPSDEVEQVLVQRFARRVPDPMVEASAAALAGLALQLRQQAVDLETDGVVLLAAWVHLDEPEVLSPAALAQLRRFPMAAHEQLVDVEQRMVAGVELQRPVERDEISTGSGTAYGLRVRPVVEVDGTREVHEQLYVTWLRPQHGAAFVLSCYTTELVEAPALYFALCALAEGVTGL